MHGPWIFVETPFIASLEDVQRSFCGFVEICRALKVRFCWSMHYFGFSNWPFSWKLENSLSIEETCACELIINKTKHTKQMILMIFLLKMWLLHLCTSNLTPSEDIKAPSKNSPCSRKLKKLWSSSPEAEIWRLARLPSSPCRSATFLCWPGRFAETCVDGCSRAGTATCWSSGCTSWCNGCNWPSTPGPAGCCLCPCWLPWGADASSWLSIELVLRFLSNFPSKFFASQLRHLLMQKAL
jgi:hypothetical protein